MSYIIQLVVKYVIVILKSHFLHLSSVTKLCLRKARHCTSVMYQLPTVFYFRVFDSGFSRIRLDYLTLGGGFWISRAIGMYQNNLRNENCVNCNLIMTNLLTQPRVALTVPTQNLIKFYSRI